MIDPRTPVRQCRICQSPIIRCNDPECPVITREPDHYMHLMRDRRTGRPYGIHTGQMHFASPSYLS
jgi:hypothetical protein